MESGRVAGSHIGTEVTVGAGSGLSQLGSQSSPDSNNGFLQAVDQFLTIFLRLSFQSMSNSTADFGKNGQNSGTVSLSNDFLEFVQDFSGFGGFGKTDWEFGSGQFSTDLVREFGAGQSSVVASADFNVTVRGVTEAEEGLELVEVESDVLPGVRDGDGMEFLETGLGGFSEFLAGFRRLQANCN